jgi:ribose/xylose/arabinose/galactoside ABC-type transport system permease subunit
MTVLPYQSPPALPPATATALATRAWRTWVFVFGPLLGLLAVYALFAVLAPRSFTTIDNFVRILVQATIVATAALGMTIIIIAGGIDLSVGSMVALVTVVTASLLRDSAPPPVAAAGGILAGLVVGLANGSLVAFLRVGPFIVTLGTLLVLRGLAKGLAHNQTVIPPRTWLNDLLAPVSATYSAPVVYSEALVLWFTACFAAPVVLALLVGRWVGDLENPGGPPKSFSAARVLTVVIAVVGLAAVILLLPLLRRYPVLLPPGVWIMLLLAALVGGLLRYTRLGRHVFAVGSNEQTARLCGINVPAVKVSVYALGGLLTGVAGLMQFSRLTLGDPTSAAGLELDVIAAVVIGGGSLSGGQGSVVGSVIGALIMTVIRNGCNQMGVENWVQEILTGTIIVLAVTLDRLRQRRSA